jgi:hypothetical protein
MKRTPFLTITAIAISAMLFVQSCKKEEDPEPEPQEFVADNNTFSGFMSWSLDATHTGPDPALGEAHAGNDNSVTRKVYFKNGQNPVSGKYPQGTVIVKHSSNPDVTVNEFTAMVKRGGNYNTSGNGWEWFMLNPDGTIAVDGNGNPMRGADLMGGMCSSCHSAASAKDYVFSK